jgi:phage recombination protein Bet
MARTTRPQLAEPQRPDGAEPGTEVATFQQPRLPWHPAIQDRFGVDRASWKALVEAIFPAARTVDSVCLALSYCRARQLDPFKRVVHIVPVWDSDLGREVETVWPGIAEHRTTAFRTKQYAGSDPAEFGETKDRHFQGKSRRGTEYTADVSFPEWCQLTVYRLIGGQRVAIHGPRVYWLETFTGIANTPVPNARWQRAPFQMIEKCAEAAALRRAFPEELGGEPIDDELGNGPIIDHAPAVSAEVAEHQAEQQAPEPSQTQAGPPAPTSGGEEQRPRPSEDAAPPEVSSKGDQSPGPPEHLSKGDTGESPAAAKRPRINFEM